MDIIEFFSSAAVSKIAVLTPVVLAVVEVVKRTVVSNTRYAPLLAVLVGALLGYFFGGLSLSYNLLLGVLSGLSAAGLWSGVKTTLG